MVIVQIFLYVPLLLGLFDMQSVQPAYINPNTGGMLFQMLVVLFGVFSGIQLFFSGRIKQAIYRARRFLREARSDDEAGSKSEGND